MVLLWPERYHVSWFWILQQALWDLAKLAVTVEIAFRVFRRFDGARPTASLVISLVLAVTTLVVVFSPPLFSHTYTVAQGVTGIIWLMTGLAVVVVWYRIPIHDFQKAILLGFVAYLTIFATLLNVLRAYGWKIRDWVNTADAAAYVMLCLWWSYAAWRKDPPSPMSPALAERIAG
jgi:hypothetical protein